MAEILTVGGIILIGVYIVAIFSQDNGKDDEEDCRQDRRRRSKRCWYD